MDDAPIPMLLWCPDCGNRHIDNSVFATKPHHTHACQHCGHVWRPAIVPTVGVQFLPGFKDENPISVPDVQDGDWTEDKV
jgi:rubredoxin